MAIDLDAYLARIGYDGPRAPLLDVLRAVHRLHPRAIAFENLDPLLGRPVRLDPASLEGKLVRGGRGGYCFEHNLLLADALRSMGFAVAGLAARVLWNQPEGAVRPRTHMLLRVDVGGEAHVADVGFGGLTLTAPLRLGVEGAQATPHEPFRLRPGADASVTVEALLGEAWHQLYRFDPQEQLRPDYEVASYYLSNHPDSIFRRTLMAARALPDRRYALADDRLAVHHRDGRTERVGLGGPAEVRRALVELFGLKLPEEALADAALPPWRG